uniref:Uncharacterized protein n=1 Tax=Parascaris equorum TaxID=6256 RepID=A0A914RMT5_PAREQ
MGVYVPNSADSICGVKSTQQLTNSNSTQSVDEREATKMAEEEFLIPTESVSGESSGGNNNERLVSVLPINLSANVASSGPPANQSSEHHTQQRTSHSHVAPPIETTAIESRNRGNFGLQKPRIGANIVENKASEESATSTQQPNMND